MVRTQYFYCLLHRCRHSRKPTRIHSIMFWQVVLFSVSTSIARITLDSSTRTGYFVSVVCNAYRISPFLMITRTPNFYMLTTRYC